MPDSVWSPHTRFLHLAPTHGSGLLVLPTLYKGGCTVTMNEPDLEVWCQNIRKENINTAMMVPTLLYRLLAMDGSFTADLRSLETVFYGAAPMSPGKLVELQAAFGNIFIQVYGSTEHTGMALSMSKADHLVDNFVDDAHLASAGRPVGGVELQIMGDDGMPVASGEIGEIWLRSRAVILGYFGNPEQTAAEFDNGFWKSGDLGRIDDQGFVYIVDRKKDMIISGGFNVYANEVEAAINSHEAVLMSAVVGIPHEEWGEAIHAEVVLKQNKELDADVLKGHVRDQLGGYKTPKSVAFVPQLPLSVAGKVLRKDVRKKYWTDENRKVS